MFDTISIGSATLDIFLKSSQFQIVDNLNSNPTASKLPSAETVVAGLCLPYGSKVNVDDFAMQSGGGATNTAVALARLGFRSAAIAEMGYDLPAEVILNELAKEGVNTSLMVQEANEQTAVSALLVSDEGGRSIVTSRGASRMLTIEDIDLNQLQAHWIHISSLGNIPLLTKIAQHCKQQRIRFSWNPGGAEIQAMADGVLHLHEIYPTLLCVNEEEAQAIAGAGYNLEAAASIVVITNGREGGRYYENNHWANYEVQPVKVVQETGAGDAFLSGMVAAYLHDRLTPEAIEWGKAQSASVIQHMGAKTGLKSNLP